jgi:ElaB/YqjD/DUF883 family membrane-anchored ribosome-binding protein
MRAETLKKPATIQSTLRGAHKIPFIVSDAVEDGVRLARRALRHGQYAAEDAVEETEHIIRQKPFQAIGFAFAAGGLAGGFLTWCVVRRR